jgi:DNA-binding LacI/PurR family transcriptional regulator
MNKEERQGRIVQLIEQSDGKHMLGTRELAQQLGVSEMTVRRDLQELSLNGLLRRQHGGAGRMPDPRGQAQKEIGILLVSKVGKFTDPFFNAVLEGVDRKLQQGGYRIAYINTWVEVSKEEQARALLKTSPVSGLILLGTPLGAESVGYLRSNVRALIVTTEPIGPNIDTVTFDGYYGMRQMVDHVVSKGCRRLGYITGANDFRYKGFIDGLKAHGLSENRELHVLAPSGLEGWTPELGYAGAEQLMKLPDPPDAIVCASDRLAIGAIQWLHQHDFQVPRDIIVTGFDNIAESAFTVPPLTTVHVHKELMGELAAERVVKHIENENEIPLLIQTPTHLVIRQSCGSEG